MATRQCEKCGETVDAAKAFCPACGHAFVEEEKRDSQSKYDSVDLTMQMGQTMYGQMLSDMGLNIDKPAAPSPPEKRVEVITPIAPAAPAQPRAEVSRPVAPAPAAVPASAKSSNRIIWIVAGIIVGFFAVLILLGLIGGAFYWYMGRGQ